MHDRSDNGGGVRVGRTTRVLLAALLFACLLPVHLALQRYAFDDAYIHVRIAQNLLERGEPYFNAGEAVNASSSAGWTWVLALWFAVVGDRPATLGVLNALLAAAGAVVWVRLVVPTRGTRSPLIPVLAACGYVALVLESSVGCMESPLALLLVGIGLQLHAQRRAPALCVFAAASFVRPELVVLLAVFALHAVLVARSRPLPSAAWIASGLLPFMLYELWFFGSLVPHTARAKTVVFSLTWRQTAESLIAALAPWPAAPWLPQSPRSRAVYLALAAVLILAGLIAAVRGGEPGPRRTACLLAAFCGASILGAYFANRVFLHAWYVPLFTVPLLFGLAAALLPVRSRAGLAGLALAVLPFLAQGAQTALASVTTPALYERFVTGARVRRYVALGRELYAAHPGARLLTSEIGGLGYGFRGTVLDGVGLISPEALPYHPLRVPEERSDGGIGAIPPRYVAATMPELIVSHPVFVQALLRDHVLAAYESFSVPLWLDEDRRRAGDPSLWGSKELLVWVRRDVAERGPGAAAGITP